MSSSTITINSKMVADAVDSQIILLIKTIQTEQQVPIDDAIETVRQYLNKKNIELLDKNNKDNIIAFVKNIKDKLKKTPNDKSIQDMYSLLKTFNVNNLG